MQETCRDRFQAFVFRDLKWLCSSMNLRLSDLYLSRTSLLGQVIYPDLLFRTGFNSIHADSFQCNAFAQRPMIMIDQKIEPGDVRCFGLLFSCETLRNQTRDCDG